MEIAVDLAGVPDQDAVSLSPAVLSREPGRWPEAPERIGLSATDVHLWLASLDSRDVMLLDSRQILSADELERSQRFHLTRDRDRFITARAFLRTVLARYVNTLPAKILFRYNGFGKPDLAECPGKTNISFNLSHSGNFALCAIARARPVGVDIEQIRQIPEARQLAERFLPPNEQRAVLHAPADQLPFAFLRYWTRSEALIKAEGRGLTLPRDLCDVPSDLSASCYQLPDVAGQASSWMLYDLTPEPGYVAALVVGGPTARISCWRWNSKMSGLGGNLTKNPSKR